MSERRWKERKGKKNSHNYFVSRVIEFHQGQSNRIKGHSASDRERRIKNTTNVWPHADRQSTEILRRRKEVIWGFGRIHRWLNKKCFEAKFKNRCTNRQCKTSCQSACWQLSCLIHEAEVNHAQKQKTLSFFFNKVFQVEKKIVLSHVSQWRYFESKDFCLLLSSLFHFQFTPTGSSLQTKLTNMVAHVNKTETRLNCMLQN